MELRHVIIKEEIQSIVEQNIVADIIRNGGGLSGQQNMKTCGPVALKRVPGQPMLMSKPVMFKFYFKILRFAKMYLGCQNVRIDIVCSI